MVVSACAAAALLLAPSAAADATEDLRSAVDSARGGCAPLQLDPLLTNVAQRANAETRSYIEHTARFIPFEDPMPVLDQVGYHASKAKLVASYADGEAKAIHGITVLGWETIPDCTFSKYGLDLLAGPAGNYVLGAVVLASD